jgi:diguanylate cyclase (GGDEF)-like protein
MRMRTAVRSLLEAATVPDSEINQALVRTRVALLYLGLLWLLHSLGQGEVIDSAWGPASIYGVFSLTWIIVVASDVLTPRIRITASILIDYTIFAYGFYAGEYGFLLVFWAPIFATIGYGLRFGIAYARACMLVGGILICTAVVFSPFWQHQPYMAAGIVISFSALPLYAMYLAHRIDVKRHEAEQKADRYEQAARTDALTGLLNRSGFSNSLREALDAPGTSALLYIDLDGFKAINDSAGHESGDHALIEVARSLQACLRASDPVARIGGDEFAVLVGNLLDPDDAYRLANKIIDAIGALRLPGTAGLSLGASIGVCLLPHPEARDIEGVMRMADVLMYRAKRAGKNCYVSSGAPGLATVAG